MSTLRTTLAIGAFAASIWVWGSALATGSPATGGGSLDLPRCIGTAPFASNIEKLTELRAGLTSEQWAASCAAARQANDRRIASVEVVLRDAASLEGAYKSAAHFAELARTATDPDVAALFANDARDQASRESLAPIEKKAYQADQLSPVAMRLLDGLIAGEAVQRDVASRAWLRQTVSRRGWFVIEKFGSQADSGAWLIVQHADADRDFQKEMIDLLKPLVATGQSSKNRFAFLYDRWAAGVGQPQLYGLQGDCHGAGVWRPIPILDPQNVDERRRDAGLPLPMAEWTATKAAQCH